MLVPALSWTVHRCHQRVLYHVWCAVQILPEVKAREDAERRAKEAERLKLAKDIAEGKAKLPTVDDVSDEEETPDLELQVGNAVYWHRVGKGT